MNAMCNLWLTKTLSKQRCIILHGAPNGGKSQLAKYCHEIFYSVNMVQAQGKFNQSLARDNVKPQIVIYDETDMGGLFRESRMADTKRFFEGMGMCWEQKGQDPQQRFEDAVCLITCNKLHKILKDPEEEEDANDNHIDSKVKPKDEDYYNRKAFEVRTKKFEFKQTYSGTGTFPFTVEEFAKTLLYMAKDNAELQEAHKQQPNKEEEEPEAYFVDKKM